MGASVYVGVGWGDYARKFIPCPVAVGSLEDFQYHL